MKNAAISLILLFLITSSSCNKSNVEKPKPVIKTDTVKTIYPKDNSYTLTITTRIDTTIRFRFTQIGKIDNRFEYFDTLGREFKQVDFSIYKGETQKIYSWSDTLEYMLPNETFKSDMIMRIESTFVSKTLKSIRKSYRGGNIDEDYNNRGKQTTRQIYLDSDVYSYYDDNGELFCLRNDVSREYLERIYCSKSDFGIAYRKILELEILAKMKIKKRLSEHSPFYKERNIIL